MAGAYHSVVQVIGSYDAQTKVFTAGSLNANVTGDSIPQIGMMSTCSATVWVESGTPSGTFYVDVTNDMRAADKQTEGNAKWVTLQSVAYTSGVDPNSNAQSQIVWINGAKFCRGRWVQSGGSGTGGFMITGVSG